jgi:hypothetical protein
VTYIPRRDPNAPGQYYPGPIRHLEHIILLFIGVPTVIFFVMVVSWRIVRTVLGILGIQS